MAATYDTDLNPIVLCESGDTFEEFTGYDLGDNAVVEGDWYLQGSACASDEANNKTGVGHSIGYDYGSDLSGSITTGKCVFAWMVCLNPNFPATFDNGGYRLLIGATTTNFDGWKVGGVDFGRNPYGGWVNVVVDPTFTPDYTGGTGSLGTWQHFAVAFNLTTSTLKGRPICMDAMRYGRGQIYATGGSPDATFAGMAAANDAGSARWGLFQAQAGGYLWKGLMSLGLSGTAVTFTDSNTAITLDNCPRTYASFTKLEINHADSVVSLTNIAFTATGTLNRGQFEVVNDANVTLTSCTFVGWDTFIFLANTDVVGCTFQGCNTITMSGAGTLTGSKINESTVAADASALSWNLATDPDGYLDNMTFVKGANAHHAITFGASSPTEMTLRGWTTSGFNAANGENDSTFYFPDTGSDVDWVINVVGGTGNFSYKKVRAGDTVDVVIDPVTLSITVKDAVTLQPITAGVRVLAYVSSGVNFPFEASVSIVSSGGTATVTHTAHGLETGDKVLIEGVTTTGGYNEYNGVKTITWASVDTYTYTVSGTPPSPATGTPSATMVLISGTTNASGVITDLRTYPSADQPFTGKARRTTSTPLYKEGPVVGTVDKDSGLTMEVFLSKDE